MTDSQQRAQRQDRWHTLASQIGPRYANARLRTWRLHGDADERQLQANMLRRIGELLPTLRANPRRAPNLLLFGPPGTGKDHIAVALLRFTVLEGGASAKWVNGLDLLGQVRDLMGTHDPESGLIAALTAPDILLVSDPLPPVGSLTEFQNAFLLRVIDSRYRQCRPTWLTVNVGTKSEMESRMSLPLVSRLSHGCQAFHFCWSDFREVLP